MRYAAFGLGYTPAHTPSQPRNKNPPRGGQTTVSHLLNPLHPRLTQCFKRSTPPPQQWSHRRRRLHGLLARSECFANRTVGGHRTRSGERHAPENNLLRDKMSFLAAPSSCS